MTILPSDNIPYIMSADGCMKACRNTIVTV